MTGKDIIVTLSQNSVVMASTKIKSHEITSQCGVIEKASSTQQNWVEVVAGRNSWSLKINYLVLTGSQVRDVLKVGEMFDITMQESGSNTNKVSGKALLNAVTGSYAVGNLAQGSFTFTGNGALT